MDIFELQRKLQKVLDENPGKELHLKFIKEQYKWEIILVDKKQGEKDGHNRIQS